MFLRKFLGTLIGDIRIVRNICIPPCFIIGEVTGKIDLSTDYRNLTRKIEIGDILISRSWGYFGSNVAIPGAFKHGMIYVGPIKGEKNKKGFIENPIPTENGIHKRCVIHAISEGVVCQDLIDVMKHCDYMAAFKANYTLHSIIDIVKARKILVEEACEKVGLPYDFGFNWRTHKSFCCTELVDYLLKKVELSTPQKIEKRVKLFGKKNKVTIADSYMTLYKLSWVSNSCYEKGFVEKSKFSKLFRMRLTELGK